MKDPMTYRYPRNLIDAFGCDADSAYAIHHYQTPLTKRLFFGLIRHGWMLVVIVLAVSVLAGCDDLAVTQAVADEVKEAPVLAQMQERAEYIEIAGVKR